MKVLVTTGDEVPVPIEPEYGKEDFSYKTSATAIDFTGLSTNYVREISTSESTLTTIITDDGTENGTPVFSDLRLCHITPLCILDTTSDNEAPWVYIRSYNHTTHTIVFGIKRSNTGSMTTGGTYQGNQNNDNSVVLRVQISGPRYNG